MPNSPLETLSKVSASINVLLRWQSQPKPNRDVDQMDRYNFRGPFHYIHEAFSNFTLS